MRMQRKSQNFLSITQAAKALGITRAAIHRAIKQGRLEADRGEFEIVKIVKMKIKGWRISAKNLDLYRVSSFHQWVGKKIA